MFIAVENATFIAVATRNFTELQKSNRQKTSNHIVDIVSNQLRSFTLAAGMKSAFGAFGGKISDANIVPTCILYAVYVRC